LNQPVVIENRGGATGMIGTDHVSKAAPDGYTVLFSASPEIVINQSLFKSVPYDAIKDLTPVTLAAITPNVLLTHPALPVRSVGEYVALAKARPGELSYSSTGSGSPQHIAGELFKRVAGIQVTHVPYKGGGPQITDLLGGYTPSGIPVLPVGTPHIRDGRVRALAVTTAKRSPAAPSIPTLEEAGFRGVDVSQWYAVFLPAGASREVAGRLNSEINTILRREDIRSRLIDLGYEPVGNGSEQFAQFVRAEISRYREIIQRTNVTLE
jgi:tripartite-type tricarboxylate transporter receptor subunit TctC